MPNKICDSSCKSQKLLKKIENYTDKKFNEINKILDIKKNYDIKLSKENQQLIISEEKKKVLVGSFLFFGIIKKDNTFHWAYMIPGVDKRVVKQIEKIKSMSHIFLNSDDEDILFFYKILTNDSLLLNDEQIPKLNSLLLYLSESIYFFNTINNSGNIQLIYLDNINEKFV